QSRFEKLFFREDVVASLRGDSTLSDELRPVALELAQEWDEDPFQMVRAAAEVIVSPDGKAEDYSRALRGCHFACRTVPGRGSFLNCLGVAQYRTGRYREALASLQEAEHLPNVQSFVTFGFLPPGLAFQAMAHFQLQQIDEARRLLDRLRENMKDP